MVSVELPPRLARILEEEARRRGTAPEAVVTEVLLRLAPPGERAAVLLESGETLLRHAEAHASRGDLEGACMRLWAAVLHLLQAAAGGEEGDPWRLSEEAAERLGDAALDAWYAGLAARIAVEQGACSRRHYEAVRDRVARLLSRPDS